MKIHAAVLAFAVLAAPSLASAQSTTVEGANTGAAVGGAAGGPLGAAVGGTVGAAVGLGLEIPNAVISSVTGVNRPSVVVEESIVVGQPLPPRVEIYEVPNHVEYRYAIVNNERVIVDPRTRRVIRVIR